MSDNPKSEAMQCILFCLATLLLFAIFGSGVVYMIRSIEEDNKKSAANRDAVWSNGYVVDRECIPAHRHWNGSNMVSDEPQYTLIVRGTDTDGKTETQAFDVEQPKYDQFPIGKSTAR